MNPPLQPGIKQPDENQEYYFKEGCYILELSNSPDDPEVSIARARVAPGTTTRWHRLHGTSERYVILQGRGLAMIGDHLKQPVGPGDVVLIPAGCAQCIQNTGDDDLVFLAICHPRFEHKAYEVITE